MKGIFLGVLLLCLPLVGYTQGLSFNLGGLYGFNFQHPGFNARVYYLANENLCFGPELSYFLPKKEFSNNQEITTSLYEFNFNFHYQFEVTHHLGIYPLIGYNYSVEREQLLDNNGSIEIEIETQNASGINIGAGMHIPIGSLYLFAEYNYVLSFGDLDDHVVLVGVFYALKFNKEKKEHE
ncbi:MAG: outer membrane beta-barrel protein [Aureispira sp.]